jgi:hypothetical protein
VQKDLDIHVAAATPVVCLEVHVVRAKRLWPRALMTPFTDDVDAEVRRPASGDGTT